MQGMQREIGSFVAGVERAVSEGKPARAEASCAVLNELLDRPRPDRGTIAGTAGAGQRRANQVTLRGGSSIRARRDSA